MADEYIRRSDALKGIELFQCGWAEIEAVQTDYIERLPAADVAPVVHGEWVTHYRSGTPAAKGYVSTCCDMWNNRKSDYCPNCGAKMDGGMEGE